MKPLTLPLLLVLAFATSGCSSRQLELDPTAGNKTVGTRFGSDEALVVIDEMTQSILAYQPFWEKYAGQQRPVVYISHIANRTDERLSTEMLADGLRTGLVRSQKFRFIDPNQIEEILQQLDLQNQFNLVDPQSAAKMGKIIGANMFIYGTLTSNTQRDGRVTERFYSLTLALINVETGELEWTDTQNLRKRSKRGIVGL